MSTLLHVLLQAGPCLERDVADGKDGLAPWTTNMSLDRLDFLEKFLPQWLRCSDR